MAEMSISSWSGDGVRLETTVTAARGSGEDVLGVPVVLELEEGYHEVRQGDARTMVVSASSCTSCNGDEVRTEVRRRS